MLTLRLMKNWSTYLMFDMPKRSTKTTIAFSYPSRGLISSQCFLVLILQFVILFRSWFGDKIENLDLLYLKEFSSKDKFNPKSEDQPKMFDSFCSHYRCLITGVMYNFPCRLYCFCYFFFCFYCNSFCK